MDEASGILYTACYNGGVRALDARGNLGVCTAGQRNASGFCDLRRMGREVGSALTTGAFIWGVVHHGTHVYASDMRAGLYKLDATALLRWPAALTPPQSRAVPSAHPAICLLVCATRHPLSDRCVR
jgi:hypothetical protein